MADDSPAISPAAAESSLRQRERDVISAVQDDLRRMREQLDDNSALQTLLKACEDSSEAARPIPRNSLQEQPIQIPAQQTQPITDLIPQSQHISNFGSAQNTLIQGTNLYFAPQSNDSFILIGRVLGGLSAPVKAVARWICSHPILSLLFLGFVVVFASVYNWLCCQSHSFGILWIISHVVCIPIRGVLFYVVSIPSWLGLRRVPSSVTIDQVSGSFHPFDLFLDLSVEIIKVIQDDSRNLQTFNAQHHLSPLLANAIATFGESIRDVDTLQSSHDGYHRELDDSLMNLEQQCDRDCLGRGITIAWLKAIFLPKTGVPISQALQQVNDTFHAAKLLEEESRNVHNLSMRLSDEVGQLGKQLKDLALKSTAACRPWSNYIFYHQLTRMVCEDERAISRLLRYHSLLKYLTDQLQDMIKYYIERFPAVESGWKRTTKASYTFPLENGKTSNDQDQSNTKSMAYPSSAALSTPDDMQQWTVDQIHRYEIGVQALAQKLKLDAKHISDWKAKFRIVEAQWLLIHPRELIKKEKKSGWLW